MYNDANPTSQNNTCQSTCKAIKKTLQRLKTDPSGGEMGCP